MFLLVSVSVYFQRCYHGNQAAANHTDDANGDEDGISTSGEIHQIPCWGKEEGENDSFPELI